MEGMQGQPMAKNMKWAMRALGVAMVPLTMSFEKVTRGSTCAFVVQRYGW